LNDSIDGADRAEARQTLRRLLNSAAGPRLRSRWRPLTASGLVRAAIGIVGFVIALAGLCMVGFAWLLSSGPIDLERFRPNLLAALQERIGSRGVVSLGPVYLTHSAGGYGLGLGFGGIKIADSQGRTLVAAPSGRIGLDVLSLLIFDVSVRRLELDGLELNLHVAKNGAISVAAARSPDAASFTLPPPPPGALAAAAANPGVVVVALVEALAGAKQPLDHVAIARGQLAVDNEALGRSQSYENLALTYDRSGSTASVAVSARGPSGPWRVSARATSGTPGRVVVEAHDLALSDLMVTSAAPAPIETDMPISFSLDARVGAEGALLAADASLVMGAGHFRFVMPDHKSFLIDEASGRLHWDPQTRRFLAQDLEMLAGLSRYRLEGALTPPAAGNAAWGAHLESVEAVYGPELPGDKPVKLDRVVADLRVFPDDGRFVLDRLSLHGPGLQGEMSMETIPQGDGVGMKLDLHAGPSSLIDGLRLWPTFINPMARQWSVEHIRSGQVLSGSMKVDWNAETMRRAIEKLPIADDSLRADFQVAGGGVDLLPGVPTLTGLDGGGSMTGKTFEVHAKAGQMDFAAGRRLAGADVYFRVPNTDPAAIVPAEAGARVTGGADALADLLGRESIKPFAGITLDPTKVKGQAQGQLTITLALGPTAKPEQQKFRVEGSLSNLTVDGYMGGEKFEQGALDMFADGGVLRLTGQGLFDTVPAKVDIAKTPSEEGQVTLNLTLDNATRARLGITPGVTLNGPMTAKLKTQFNRQGADAEVDLSKLEIDGIDGVLLKAAGKPGKATFAVKSGADGMAVSNLVVDAGALSAHGQAQFGPDGQMQEVKLAQLRFTPNDDLRLDLQGGTPLKASVRGATLDARGLVKAFLSRDPSAANARELDLDAKIADAGGHNGEAIVGLDMTMTRRGGVMKTLNATGKLGEGPFSVTKTETGPLELRAADGGATARFLDLYNRIEGGALTLTMRDDGDSSRGVASMKGFVLRNEDALKKMTSAAPAPNPARKDSPGAGSDSGSVRFDRLNATFTRTSGRIDIGDLLVYNVQEGISAQGYLDYGRDKVEISGTFVPIYALNSLVSGIPLVGVLLSGGAHEGIFGVNFRITGPASSPTLMINPLSGVTPGIFRKIFGVIDGTQGPSEAPAK